MFCSVAPNDAPETFGFPLLVHRMNNGESMLRILLMTSLLVGCETKPDKYETRDPARYASLSTISRVEPNPDFLVGPGDVETWEKV